MESAGDKIVFVCTHCGKGMATRPDRAGKTVHCIRCRCAVRIPLTAPAGVPAPQPAGGHGSRSGTVAGDPAAFDTRVVPSPRDVEIVTTNSAGPARATAAASAKRAGGEKLERKTLLRRVAVPVGAGALCAAVVIALMAVALRSAAPIRAVRAEATTAPAGSGPTSLPASR